MAQSRNQQREVGIDEFMEGEQAFLEHEFDVVIGVSYLIYEM